MIHVELILTNQLLPEFHAYCEQITGVNTASVVQATGRPRSKLAETLAYFKAFNQPDSDTHQVREFFGLLSFGMMCAGPEIDMAEVTGWPHGLKCLSGPPSRRGATGVAMFGDGEQWIAAVRSALSSKTEAVYDWAVACYRQFGKHDLTEYFGTLRPQSGGQQFLLEG